MPDCSPRLSPGEIAAGILSLVGALAWNNAIREVIDDRLKGWSRHMTSLVYAVVVTILIAVVIIVYNYAVEKSDTFRWAVADHSNSPPDNARL